MAYTELGPEFDERAERMFREDVFCNLSMIVSDLEQIDEWREMISYAIYDSAEACGECDACQEYLSDDDNDPEDLCASDCDEPQIPDVYEWWAVSAWLARHLAEAGEVVLTGVSPCLWGRTCTGQGVILDGTLQRIAHRIDVDLGIVAGYDNDKG